MVKPRSVVVGGLPGVLACLAVACSTYATTLKPKAASSLHCEQSQIAIAETSTLCQVVTGCGRSDVLLYEADKWNSFRERLAFELSCPDADIDLKILTPTTYGVTGCGKKLVYKYISTPGTVGIFADTSSTDSAAGTPVK